MERKLMVSFVLKNKIKKFVNFLYSNNITEKIFILESESQENVWLVSYNIRKNVDLRSLREYGVLNTLSVQRNKESNTLYSINALNLIITEHSEKLNKSKDEIQMDWSKYTNTVLTLSNGKLNRIETNLRKYIKFGDFFDIKKFNIK